MPVHDGCDSFSVNERLRCWSCSAPAEESTESLADSLLLLLLSLATMIVDSVTVLWTKDGAVLGAKSGRSMYVGWLRLFVLYSMVLFGR